MRAGTSQPLGAAGEDPDCGRVRPSLIRGFCCVSVFRHSEGVGIGYRSLDEAKRILVNRMRSEVDPTKDCDSLIRVRSTPPQREDDGEVSLDFEKYRGLPPVCCPRCTHQEQSDPNTLMQQN